jgi:hypothetical protein
MRTRARDLVRELHGAHEWPEWSGVWRKGAFKAQSPTRVRFEFIQGPTKDLGLAAPSKPTPVCNTAPLKVLLRSSKPGCEATPRVVLVFCESKT